MISRPFEWPALRAATAILSLFAVGNIIRFLCPIASSFCFYHSSLGHLGWSRCWGSCFSKKRTSSIRCPRERGKERWSEICSECHSLENVVNQRNTASGWEAIIDQMTLRGAQVFADDRKMVVAYLDKYYGLDRSEREALMTARYACLF